MILYHGSYLEIQTPNLLHSSENVDFGRGFYTTPLYDQAVKWCEKFKRRGKNGIVSRYIFDEKAYQKLKILRFESYSEEWLDFILKCRTGNDTTDYDIVIAYQEGYATDFAKYIHAKKKIAWVHTIYQKFACAYKNQSQLYDTYKDYNKIVCVASGAVEAFCKGMPTLKNKVCLIQNPLISSRIKQRAEENIGNNLLKHLKNSCTCIVSVGRLSSEKQYDVAVKVADKLHKKNKQFVWFIAGDGPEKNKLQKLVDEYQLKENVILTGLLLNPYPLIKCADVLVITSMYEAQPMVANEALILGTPVITTNYQTAYTLIRDNVNGMICENSCDSITNAILKYIEDDVFANNLKCGAEAFEYDNNSIIKSIRELMDK